jgi:DNA-binding MarR family transcriptional regulator
MGNERKAAATQFGVGDEIRAPLQLERNVGYVLRRAQLRVYDSFYTTLAHLDTTPTRFTLMLLIRENPGIRSVDLARVLGVARSGMVKLVSELEKRGLIVREILESDRRNQALGLTAAGRRKLTQLERAAERHELAITKDLGAAERKRLLELLARVAV